MLAECLLVLLIVYAVCYAATLSIYIAVIIITKSKAPQALSTRPKVAILIAARNEAHNLRDCLETVVKLSYSKELMEVRIGDDGSEDNTGGIIREYVDQYDHIKGIKIEKQLPGLKGKQNVLAQLAQNANADFLMVTDADILLPSNWVETMLAAFDSQEVGMVSGATLVQGKGILSQVQQLDWLNGMGLIYTHQKLGIPITGIGNNMAIRTEAYREAGGYENIPFSIVEDYKLFQVLCEQNGWKSRQLLSPNSLAHSKPISGLKALLRQRKRWFKGAKEIPWYNKVMLAVNGLFLPVLLLLGGLTGNWSLLLELWAGKVILDSTFFVLLAMKLNVVNRLKWLPLYHLLSPFFVFLMGVNQLLPGAVNWKGRKYT